MKPITSIDEIKVGGKVRLHYGKDHCANTLYHVRGIVDEEVFVLKSWHPRKHYWVYKTEYKDTFEYYIERGCIFKG